MSISRSYVVVMLTPGSAAAVEAFVPALELLDVG